MLEDVARTSLAPFPQLAASAGRLARRAVLARLGESWGTARIDLLLPGGARVRLGDPGPAEATVRVLDERMFLRVLLRGELGAGEAFVAGEWASEDLVAACRAFLRGTRARGAETPLARLGSLRALLRHRRAANSIEGSARNIHAHYDLGNAFYATFLDPEALSYSCAIAPAAGAFELAAAQRAKHEQLCGWLELSPRDHLLEIGCGWGGMAIHAAATRGCRVTAVTVSAEQHELARARVAAAGLGDRVEILHRDYRELEGRFDKLVSIEMIEAVGYAYLPEYFSTCARLLRPGGAFALQSITMPEERFEAYRRGVDWMQTYVFPGSLIPSLGAIDRAAAPAGLHRERIEDIGPHYAPTVAAWRARFLDALPRIRELGFDSAFIRTWLLYLAFSEAAFAERTLGDHQILFRRG